MTKTEALKQPHAEDVLGCVGQLYLDETHGSALRFIWHAPACRHTALEALHQLASA